MRLADRYIFRETAIPSVIALFTLSAILVGREVGSLLEFLVRWEPSFAEVARLLAALAPPVLTFTIPTAVLVGVLTGLGRMSSDSESIAFRAGGLSTWSLLRPVFTLGCLAWAANIVLSVWIAPASFVRLESMMREIGQRQLALEVQPRVFNENLPGVVLHVQDVSLDGRHWDGVLLADLRTGGEIRLIVADSADLIGGEGGGRYEVRLSDGSLHVSSRENPGRYDHSPFGTQTRPIPAALGPAEVPVPDAAELRPTSELWESIRSGEANPDDRVEFHRRLALPFASVAFALIGLPLGLSTRRGGRSMGLVVSVLLMLVYYMFFIGGTRIAGNAQMSPVIGTWGTNVGFALLGLLLLVRLEKEGTTSVVERLAHWSGEIRRRLPAGRPAGWAHSFTHSPSWIRTLDLYVLKSFWFYFGLVLAVFTSLFVVVTLFELLPDIVNNDVGVGVVAGYFIFLVPQIYYWVSPLSVLVAVLISLGTLTKTNQTLAVKAGAISMYRMVVPLLVTAFVLSAGTYFLEDFLLPYTNRQQDSFRNTIKGRAEQTYQDPLRKWMAGSGNRVYYYSYFDPDLNTFYDLDILEFEEDPYSLVRWTFAARGRWERGRWELESGWSRSAAPGGTDEFEQFTTRTGLGIPDGPDYFKKEVRTASQMNYPELKRYIEDLGNSGFDVSGLRVDLYRKLAFPIVTLIMAVIAIPFSFTTGRRGAFHGIGISIVIGVAYWGAIEIFDKLGGLGQLSPLVAAWLPNLIFGVSGTWMLLRVKT